MCDYWCWLQLADDNFRKVSMQSIRPVQVLYGPLNYFKVKI